KTLLELVHFDDRRPHQRPVYRGQTLQSWTVRRALWIGGLGFSRIDGAGLTQLSGQFCVAGLKEADEGTLTERTTDSLDLGELVAAPKHIEKIHRLAPRSPKDPEFIENDAPRHD